MLLKTFKFKKLNKFYNIIDNYLNFFDARNHLFKKNPSVYEAYFGHLFPLDRINNYLKITIGLFFKVKVFTSIILQLALKISILFYLYFGCGGRI